MNEQDPYLPPSAASQAIAARTLRGQGSYPPTAPPLNPNAHGNHTIKQPLLLTPPPPSYATATARARQMHESMSKFVHDYFLRFNSPPPFFFQYQLPSFYSIVRFFSLKIIARWYDQSLANSYLVVGSIRDERFRITKRGTYLKIIC